MATSFALTSCPRNFELPSHFPLSFSFPVLYLIFSLLMPHFYSFHLFLFFSFMILPVSAYQLLIIKMPQEDLSTIRESLFTELAAVYVSFDTLNSPECSALSSLSCPLSLKPSPVHTGDAPWALPAINPPQLKSGDMFSFPSFRCLITEQIATFISQFLLHNFSIFNCNTRLAYPLCPTLLVVFGIVHIYNLHTRAFMGISWVMNDGTFCRANWHISVAHTATAWC